MLYTADFQKKNCKKVCNFSREKNARFWVIQLRRDLQFYQFAWNLLVYLK